MVQAALIDYLVDARDRGPSNRFVSLRRSPT